MNSPLAYGIDFGTSNSSISIAYPDRVELVDVGTANPEILPSIVYLHRNGQRAAGEDAVQQHLVTGSARTRCSRCELVDHHLGTSACKQHRIGQGCLDSRLPVSLKSELAQTDFVSTHSWAIDFTLPDLVAVVLRELKRRADRICGADVRRVVLGHPVVFVGAEGPEYQTKQGLAQERLKDAATKAGFEEVVLLEEPAAAVMDEQLESGLAMAVDFGGGTFDVALIRFSSEGGEVVALTGADIGGELFDKVLFEAKVAPALGLDGILLDAHGKQRQVPKWFQNRLLSLGDAMHLLSDPSVPGLIKEYLTFQGGQGMEMVDNILHGGQTYNFYKEIEKTKIALSDHPNSVLEFHRPGIDITVPVSRAEFEELISPYLDAAMAQVHKALDDAHVRPEEVDLVLRTGGSSSIPSFVTRLEELFGTIKVVKRPAFSAVAMGLGAFAQMEWAS